MISYEGPSMNRAYEQLVHHVRIYGKPADPRGLKCQEIRPYAFTLYFPDQGLYTGVTRRLNYRFFAVEALMYMAGWGGWPDHAELLCASNSNMERFRNKETGVFDGAYGPRLRESLGSVYELLKRDPYSRQAVASIWSPGIPQNSNDVPCTLNLHFYADVLCAERGRHSDSVPRLAMTASMRSNDLNWGTPYDVGAFCAIQTTMAGCLGWNLGDYHHVASSFHIYETTPPVIKPQLEEIYRSDLYIPNLGVRMMGLDVTWDEVRSMASAYLYSLRDHVLFEKQPWYTFRSSFEAYADRDPMEVGLRAVKLGIYWREWSNLVRFRWTPKKCDQSSSG